MTIEFLNYIKKLSDYARLNILTEDEFAYKFFVTIGYDDPADEELTAAFATLPDAVLVEFLRMLDIYYKADQVPPAASAGGTMTMDERIAEAQANHPIVKRACEFLRPKVVGRIDALIADRG